MTTVEKRAFEACRTIKEFGALSFSVVWVKSNTWGMCPRIEWRGKKAAYASGCGYDKLSAVLVDFLHPLVPELAGCSGAGVSSVADRLAKHGWMLIHEYDGQREDGFSIRRVT
jgi:hypothetical protein